MPLPVPSLRPRTGEMRNPRPHSAFCPVHQTADKWVSRLRVLIEAKFGSLYKKEQWRHASRLLHVCRCKPAEPSRAGGRGAAAANQPAAPHTRGQRPPGPAPARRHVGAAAAPYPRWQRLQRIQENQRPGAPSHLPEIHSSAMLCQCHMTVLPHIFDAWSKAPTGLSLPLWRGRSACKLMSCSASWPQVCIPQASSGSRRLLSSVDLAALDTRDSGRPQPAAPSSAPAGGQCCRHAPFGHHCLFRLQSASFMLRLSSATCCQRRAALLS